MAQIKLTIVSDTKNAETSIKNLKTEISALAKDYEKVSASSKKANPVNDIGAVAKSTAANIETLRKSYSNLITQLKTLKGQYDNGIFDKVSASVEQNQKQIVNLSKAYQQNGKLTEQQQAVARQLSNDYKKLSADIAQLKAENDKLRVSDPFSTNISDNVSRLQKRYQSLLGTIQSISKYYPKGTFDSLTQSIQADVAQLNSLDKTAASSLPTLNKLNSSILQQEAAFAQARNSATNYHGTLRDLVSGFLKFQVAAMLVMKPLQLIQSAISSINETLVETEKVVVSLQRVLDETVASGEISSELYAIAENLGQTFDNVQEIAQNFAKAGLSWQDTLKATEAAVLALNVAELTAEESSEGLIAVMQQFNYEASELTYVIDVLNKAADKSAVDTQELLVALQKTGSYASAANLSLEETVGLISALSEATAASGQNIGNPLKSLFAYSSKASSLEMFASLSDDMKAIVDMYQIGNASILDVWEELADTMTNLSDAQADLLTQWSSESGLETELGAELGDVYEQMSGVWDTAGVYRKNYFIALLNNFDEVKNVMGEISDAAGYTAEEQAKYMDTYEAKLNSLQAQWEELANDEQGWLAFKKGLLDIASGLLTAIEYTGGLRTVVLALGTALWIAFGDKIVSAVKSFGTALKGLVTGLQSIRKAGLSAQTALGWIGVAATAISLIAGAITQSMEAAEQAAEEARQAAIDSWNAVSEEATQLNELYQQYLKLSQITEKTFEQQEEWATVQKNLVDLLGTQAIQLAGLTEGTEEYNKKLEEQIKLKIHNYRLDAQYAANAAKEEINNKNFSNSFEYYTGTLWHNKEYYDSFVYEDIYEAAKQAGFDISRREDVHYSGGKGLHERYDVLNLTDNIFEQSTRLEEFASWLQEVGYGETELFDNVYLAYKERIDTINTLLDTVPAIEYYDYVIENGFVDTQAEFDEVVDRIMESVGATEDWRDEIEGLVSDYSGFNKELEDTNKTYDDQIKKIETLGDAVNDLADALKEMRNAEEESVTLEEKKLAVLEAQKALEEAKNNRSVRRYNDATGQFEWTTDESAVQDAESELKEAITALNEYVEGQAWDSVIEELESGNATNESILAILNEWEGAATGVEGGDSSWYNAIIQAIYGIAGVDLNATETESNEDSGSETDNSRSNLLDRVEQAASAARNGDNQQMLALLEEAGLNSDSAKKLVALYLQGNKDPLISALENSGAFDSGGIANGLDYLAKVTAEPEVVNNPELTAKILAPTSNTQLDRYVRDMGILFENARQYTALKPIMQSAVGNTTNNNTNTSYTINGVKIGSDMLTKPFGEVLRMVGMVPNK